MANITNSNKIIDLLNGIKQRLQQIEDSIPENVSELTNDAGYITNAVSDLVNYYDKGEVDDLLAGIVGLDIRKVNQLPDEGEAGVIYLVPSPSAQDTYDEYIWVAVDSAFEKLGNFHVDFSNYYDKDEVDNLLDQKADASDIPTVNDGTLDIQLNGTSVETFSANSENNKTANIEVTKSTVGLGNVDNTPDADKPISTATQAALDLKADKTEIPTKTSELTNDSDFITSADLPTVNDARITVQKNSESVDSFTLNQNTDNTINITINKNDVGLGNVDNTSDANKPISDATQAALDLKADKTELPTVNDASVTVKQGTSTKGTFTLNQAGDVTIELDEGGDGDVKYSDFEFTMVAVSPEGEATIGYNLSGILNANRDITLLPHDELKPGMQYILKVVNTASNSVSIVYDCYNFELAASEEKYLVFLATDTSTLELQTAESGGGSGPSVTVGDGNITVQNQYGEELGSFSVNQTEDAVITINESTASGDMKYQDFNFVTGSGATVALDDFNVSITPDADFTVTKGSTSKDGQVYILRVTNEGTPVTMTLGNGITNPFNVDLTLTEDGVDQFVFLATEGVLELQPQLLTKADVEQILRDHGLIP